MDARPLILGGTGDGPRAYAGATVVPPVSKRERRTAHLKLAILDAGGALVAAGVSGTERKTSRGYIPTAEEAVPTEFLAGTWLFGGLVSHHFGHQITRSLGRLAGLEEAGQVDGILYCPTDFRALAPVELERFAGLLAGLRVDLPWRVATTPTRVERLIVGPDRFGEMTAGRADPGYVVWARSSFVPQRLSTTPGKRLYITRGRLPAGFGRILCEDVLEENLAAAGYEVFAPETVGVAEQLAAYRSAERIVAMECSALHLVAFALGHEGRVTVIQRRKERLPLIENQLASFVGDRATFVDCVTEVSAAGSRAANAGLTTLNFDGLRAALTATGDLSCNATWRSPTEEERKASLARSLPAAAGGPDRAVRSPAHEPSDPVPAMDGMRYLRMLRRMHAILKPRWYLEVGTFTGRSLALAECDRVAVDPEFRIRQPVPSRGARRMFLFREPSNDFFASGFAATNGIAFDLAFLNGSRQCEALLRDFINAERLMAPGGIIVLHDVCPMAEQMAPREAQEGELWTGDVWKTLLILKRYRPDLEIRVASAAPTGLAVIRNLDPGSRALESVYGEAVAGMADMSLAGLPGGIGGLYRLIGPEPPETVLRDIQRA